MTFNCEQLHGMRAGLNICWIMLKDYIPIGNIFLLCSDDNTKLTDHIKLAGLYEPANFVFRLLEPLLATRELEGCDTGAPIERTTCLQVFTCEPEGAIINRVNAHGAVIAPAVEAACLGTTTSLEDIFSLHCTGRVSDKPSCITDAWEN